MDAIFRNIYTLFFAVMALLAFTLFKASQLLEVHYPAGLTHFLVLSLFFFLWYRFGSGRELPPHYGKLLAAMALFLFAAFWSKQGTAGVYAYGTVTTFLFTVIFLIAYNIELPVDRVLDLFKSMYALIPLLSIVTVFDVIVDQVPFRDAFTLLREPGAFAGLLIYGILLGLTLFTIYKNSQHLIFSGLMSLLVAVSTYKKSIITLGLVWFFFLTMERKWSRKVLYFYLFLAAATVGYFWVGQRLTQDITRNIHLYSDKSDTIARAVLLKTGFLIAVNKFPFGSGLGTFASVPSVNVHYSDVYYQYGVNKVWGLGPSANAKGVLAILDCYWAHILGELGFIGSILFLGLWSYPALYARFACRRPANNLEWGLKYFIYTMTAVMTFDGLVYYYAENPAFIIVHAGLMGLALRLLHRCQAPDPEPSEDLLPVPGEDG